MTKRLGDKSPTEDVRTISTGIQGMPRLMLNQGADDGNILEFKSSDVAHGITDVADTETYGLLRKAVAASGGIRIDGLKDAGDLSGYAMMLVGTLGEAADTTKSVSGHGVVVLQGGVISGSTGPAVVGADGNVVTIRSHETTRFIFDAEGEMHSDAVIGAGDDWDGEDDLQLAADLSRMPKAKWDQVVRYHAEDFERAGLVTLSTDDDGTQHAFYKHRAMLDFHNCTFAAVLERMQAQDGRIEQLEQALLKAGGA